MPANESVTSRIIAESVPPDRECPRNGTEILALVQDFGRIESSNPEAPQSTTDSTAQLALETANNAIAQVEALKSQILPRRTSGTLVPVPALDSTMPIVWAPPMPHTDYEVRLVFYVPTATPATAYYGYRVVEPTRTVGGVNVQLDNMPANTLVSWVVEALKP